MMNDHITQFFDLSKKINTEIITFTRCLLLVLMAYSIDGLQYRELKAILNISDGKLKSNLNKLSDMNYIRKSEVELDQKKLDIYELTDDGKREFDKILGWMKLILNMVNNEC